MSDTPAPLEACEPQAACSSASGRVSIRSGEAPSSGTFCRGAGRGGGAEGRERKPLPVSSGGGQGDEGSAGPCGRAGERLGAATSRSDSDVSSLFPGSAGGPDRLGLQGRRCPPGPPGAAAAHPPGAAARFSRDSESPPRISRRSSGRDDQRRPPGPRPPAGFGRRGRRLVRRVLLRDVGPGPGIWPRPVCQGRGPAGGESGPTLKFGPEMAAAAAAAQARKRALRRQAQAGGDLGPYGPAGPARPRNRQARPGVTAAEIRSRDDRADSDGGAEPSWRPRLGGGGGGAAGRPHRRRDPSDSVPGSAARLARPRGRARARGTDGPRVRASSRISRVGARRWGRVCVRACVRARALACVRASVRASVRACVRVCACVCVGGFVGVWRTRICFGTAPPRADHRLGSRRRLALGPARPARARGALRPEDSERRGFADCAGCHGPPRSKERGLLGERAAATAAESTQR